MRGAKQALRAKLAVRSTATGFGTDITPDSSMAELAAAWLEDVKLRPDLAPSSKDHYAWQVKGLILPNFSKLRLREVTTGRVDRFLTAQAAVSYARARASRTVLNLMFGYALRHDAVAHNPVAGAGRLKKPKRKVTALTLDQLEQVRAAAAAWRSGERVRGPKPDGQVQDLIEVLIGTGDRIGEALAFRKCDVDDSRRAEGKPMRVTIAGTLVTVAGKGTYRQEFPKTDNSRRTLEVPEFAADVIRRRLRLIEDAQDEHLLFYSRTGTPLTPHNVRRTLRAMLTAANVELKISPHAFRRTGGTAIARASDSQTAADALGNTRAIAEAHCIEKEGPTPITATALHLEALAPRQTRHPRAVEREAQAVSSKGV